MEYIAIFSCIGDVIGDRSSNDLVVYDKDDMKHFKESTDGNIVIMGRKTVDSLPHKLPNRITVCVTKDTNHATEKADVVLHSVEAVLAFCEGASYHHGYEKAFVCGGAEIYDLFSEVVDKLIVTKFWGHPPTLDNPATIPYSIKEHMDDWGCQRVRENDRFEILEYVRSY